MRRKKPRREESIWEMLEVTETEEISTEATPWRVNPNFSKRIIGRSSDRIFNDLISALDVEVKIKSKMRITAKVFGKFVILRITVVVDGGGRWWLKKEIGCFEILWYRDFYAKKYRRGSHAEDEPCITIFIFFIIILK